MPWLNISNVSNNKAKVYITGFVVSDAWWDDDKTDPTNIRALEKLDVDEIDVYINSPGGEVFAGVEIYNILKRQSAKVTTYVDGVAASIASIIFQAGDVRVMPSNTLLMIHEAIGSCFGTADDVRKCADEIEKIGKTVVLETLKNSSNLTEQDLLTMMANETWFNAEEAFNAGLVDIIDDNQLPVTNKKSFVTLNGIKLDKNRFKNLKNLKIDNVEPEKEKPYDFTEIDNTINDILTDVYCAEAIYYELD